MSLLSDIRPTDRQERYIGFGNVLSEAAWLIGREINREWEETERLKDQAAAGKLHGEYWTPTNIARLLATGKMDLYRDVAALIGKRERRTRQYTETAAFYPPEVQEAYSALPHSHFEFAMALGDKWRDVLELSYRQMHNSGGRPPSVAWLEMSFPGVNSIEPVQALQDVTDIPYGNEDPTQYNYEPVLPTSPGTAYALDRLNQAIAAMSKLAKHLDVTAEQANRLEQAIRLVGEIICDIRTSIRSRVSPTA